MARPGAQWSIMTLLLGKYDPLEWQLCLANPTPLYAPYILV